MEFEHVFRDIRAEFMDNLDLRLRVDPNVYDRLCDFYDCSLVPLLTSGRVSWEHHHRQRKFVLACAAGLGRKADQEAAKHGRDRITGEDVEAAAYHLLGYWEATCVLPPARPVKGDAGGGPGGCAVAELLKGKAPTRPG